MTLVNIHFFQAPPTSGVLGPNVGFITPLSNSIFVSDGKSLKSIQKRSLRIDVVGKVLVTWRNKYVTVESKIKIYKAVVRPIMTYGAETRAATTKTKQLLRTTEMNT